MTDRGRPRKLESPEQLEQLTDAYLTKCETEQTPVTLTGALIFMGIFSRATLGEYEKREGFSEPVKRLRAYVENSYEQRLHGNSPTGAIFALKNMGWEDRSQTELSGPDGKDLNLWGSKPE